MKIKCDTCDRTLDVDGRRVFAYCLCGSEIQTRKCVTPKYKLKRTLD
jgi:hypothetical protein